jgi:hypothetical protein
MLLWLHAKAIDSDSRHSPNSIHVCFRIKFSDSTLPPSYKTKIKLKGKVRDSKPDEEGNLSSRKTENPQASPPLYIQNRLPSVKGNLQIFAFDTFGV